MYFRTTTKDFLKYGNYPSKLGLVCAVFFEHRGDIQSFFANDFQLRFAFFVLDVLFEDIENHVNGWHNYQGQDHGTG